MPTVPSSKFDERRIKAIAQAIEQFEGERLHKTAETQLLKDTFNLSGNDASAVRSRADKLQNPYPKQILNRGATKVKNQLEDQAISSVADLITVAIQLGGVTLIALILLNWFVGMTWLQRAQQSGSVGLYFIENTLGLNIPFIGGKGGDAMTDAGDAVTGRYASPLPGKSLADLVSYKPRHGQSFGPETGNNRSYGPHGGVDFDCRVGGCAGAAVAAPISGKVSAIEKIGTSANGASYRVKILGTDWGGTVEHRLVHVDSLSVQVGDQVQSGQIVAKVSPTDSVSTGPHLDWKVRRNGAWENPQKWAQRAMESGVSDGPLNMQALLASIQSQESGGNPSAVNTRTGAMGLYQILPSNISGTNKGWDQQCLGRDLTTSQFLASPQLQHEIAGCKMREYAATHQRKAKSEEELVRRVASTWYSGNGDKWNNTRPQGPGGTEPSIAEYTDSIWSKYQAQK